MKRNFTHVFKGFTEEFEKRAKVLTTEARKELPVGEFVFPKERRYPIHDQNHARAALSMVAKHGTPEEQAKVKAAVHSKYPEIGKESK